MPTCRPLCIIQTQATVQMGDLLFFYNDLEKVHHVGIITGFNADGMILYSAHSNDRINEPITQNILNSDKLIVVKIKNEAK